MTTTVDGEKQSTTHQSGADAAVTITLYSKPACPQCTATKSVLDRSGVAYQVIDVAQSPDAADTVRELGYAALPVVVVGDAHWSGFRPARLAEAVALVAGCLPAAA